MKQIITSLFLILIIIFASCTNQSTTKQISNRIYDSTLFTSPHISICGFPLPNPQIKSLIKSGITPGITLLYTCPIGKKALFFPDYNISNTSTATISYNTEYIKNGKEYPNVTMRSVIGGGYTYLDEISPAFILTPTDSFCLKLSGIGGSACYTNNYIEFDDIDTSVNIKTIKAFEYSPMGGSMFLYTCPTNKKAFIIGSTAQSSIGYRGSIAGFNSSGSNVFYTLYMVPPSGSPSISNIVVSRSNNFPSPTGQTINMCGSMDPGYSLYMTSTSPSLNQFMYLTVIEY